MRALDRRSFLFAAAATAAFPFEQIRPDLVLINGNFWTVNPHQPRAQAVAIANGRFFAVGTNDEITALAAPGAKRIDLGGKTVLPGFIDGHCHPAQAGLSHLTSVDCDLRSIKEILQALRARAAQTKPNEWVLGFKYDDTKIAEGRPLTRADLDAAIPDHPVFVEHRGGHTAWVNSLAMRLAGVDEKTPDPQGGRFGRDESGRLNGNVKENAREAFSPLLPSKFSPEQRRAGVKLIARMLAKSGITSTTDAFAETEDLRAYQDAHTAGELSVRVYCLVSGAAQEKMLAAGVIGGFGDEMVRAGGFKFVCDGSISERTARLSQPYIGRPNDFGILVNDEAALYEQMSAVHRAGWQIGTHANGDVAIDKVLRVYDRLQREYPRRDPRFRIEHCTVLNPDLIARIKAQGVIPTPFSTYVYYHGEKMREYGAERVQWMFALRSLLDAGIPATQASDYPPGPFEPMMALQSEVTRTDMKGNVWGPNQRISVEEAIRVGTMNGARASFDERVKGSIEPGKLADLVVLGRDPFKEPPQNLVNIPIERTMMGGNWTYEA
jgi:predicted amidohydrolase YtcJ